MSFSSETAKVQYNGDGVTTEFAVIFYFLQNADVQVVHRDALKTETLWVEGTHFTLTGVGNTSGGTITILTFPINYTPLAGETLTVSRSLAKVQETDYPEGGAFPASAHEQALDRVVQLIQQLQEQVDRSIKFPITDGSVSAQLNSSSDRANKFLNFDGDGNVSLDTTIGNWLGSYSAASTYNINDVVDYSGSSYISLVAPNLNNTPPVPGVAPDSYWGLVARKGDTGDPGNMTGPGTSTDNALARFNGVGGAVVDDSGWTINDSNVMDGADNQMKRVNFLDVAWVHKAHGDTLGADITIDLEQGNYHSMTISTDAVTLSFSNWVSSGELQCVLLKIVNGGSQTLNLPASADFEGGAQAWTFSAAGTDFVLVWTDDGGTITHWQQVAIGSA